MTNPIAFSILVASLLGVIYVSWWSKKFTTNTTDFYVAGGKISARLNGQGNRIWLRRRLNC